MERTWCRAVLAALAGGIALGWLGAAQAQGATSLGQAFSPNTGCGASTFIQSSSPGNLYSAPFSGVITSWTYQASATPPAQLRLKVARSAGGDFTIVGESSLQAPVAGTLETFPTRIPAQAGDVIGFYQSTSAQCGTYTAGYADHYASSTDVAPGGPPLTYSPGGVFQLAIGATIEPDADHDGFGDETQDACPSDSTTQGACPTPATMRPAPHRKCKKRKLRAVAAKKCRKRR